MMIKGFGVMLIASFLFCLPLSASAGLLPVEVSDGVYYVTGGVGLDESTAIEEMRPDYPLTLLFAESTKSRGNQFVSGVQVEMRRGGELVLEARTDGPYLLVKVPPGSYQVTATHNGVPKKMTISVGTRPKQVGWAWPAPEEKSGGVDPY